MDSSEDFKLDCLARFICKLEGRAQRREFMRKVSARHGEAFKERLAEKVRREWGKR